MSILSLNDVKSYLDVIHDADDDKLQLLLDGAEDEAAQFLDRQLDELFDDQSSEQVLPGSVVMGIMLLLQAAYQASPDDAVKLRLAAEVKLSPYRVRWGV